MATIAKNYQMAAGHDNTAGLELVNILTDANGVRFVMPRGLPFRSRGERRYRTDGSIARVGFDQVQWHFSAMTLAQYAYMIATYEGLVTIHHPLTSTVFANFNASLWLPDEIDMNYGVLNGSVYDAGFTGPGYHNVVLTFNHVEAI